jgi:hypothetical protein
MNLQRSLLFFYAKQSNTFLVALALIVCTFAASSLTAFAQDAADVAKPAMAAAVWVEKLDASGNTVKRSSGFVVKDGRVATSFRSIDGAMSLKLIFSDGKEVRTDQIAGLNRYQDWVLIPLEDKSRPGLTLVSKKSSAGDHCYWLEVKPDGTRSVADGQVTGVTTSRPWGDRIAFSGKFSYAALGGPLLDAQGQVIGILGGALPEAYLHEGGATAAQPATASLAEGQQAAAHPADADDVYEGANGTAIEASLLPQTLLAGPRALKALWDNGDMTPPVTNSKYVQSGLITSKDDAKKKGAERVGASEFKKSVGTALVVISFDKQEALKTTAQIKIFDFENHPIAAGEVEKFSLKKGTVAEKNWDIPVSDLPAGIYRVDILIGDGIAWREYFKVAD